MRCHGPLGHASESWMGQDLNLRCLSRNGFTDRCLRPARQTHPWGGRGESNPCVQSHNLPDYRCPTATAAPAGIEPSISALRGRNLYHLTRGPSHDPCGNRTQRRRSESAVSYPLDQGIRTRIKIEIFPGGDLAMLHEGFEPA